MTDAQILTNAITCADCGEHVEEYESRRCTPCWNKRDAAERAEVTANAQLRSAITAHQVERQG